MAKRPSLLVSGATGGAVASVIAGLGCAAGQAPFSILAGLACGTAAALAVWRSRGPLCPISDRIRAIPEADKVLERGYQICFRQGPASKTSRRWTFTAHLRNRTVGCLEVDFIEANSRLFVANVYVVESRGNRGLGTALLLCAAKTTDCRVVTSSSRTRQGVGFFVKARLVLKGYGVEMRDPPSTPAERAHNKATVTNLDDGLYAGRLAPNARFAAGAIAQPRTRFATEGRRGRITALVPSKPL